MTDAGREMPELLPCPFCGGKAEIERATIERCARVARTHSDKHEQRRMELFCRPGEGKEDAAAKCADEIEEEIRAISVTGEAREGFAEEIKRADAGPAEAAFDNANDMLAYLNDERPSPPSNHRRDR